MEKNEDIAEKTSQIISNSCTNKRSLQENFSELFRIDVTGRESKDDTKSTSDEDEDECDYIKTVRRHLFKVDAVGQDGNNEDPDTDHSHESDNCLTGNIIFIKCTNVCMKAWIMDISIYGLFLAFNYLC